MNPWVLKLVSLLLKIMLFLKIYDILGKEVKTLSMNRNQPEDMKQSSMQAILQVVFTFTESRLMIIYLQRR